MVGESAAKLVNAPPEGLGGRGQTFGSEEDQRDDEYDEQFEGSDVGQCVLQESRFG
jgi:hypothetical protein